MSKSKTYNEQTFTCTLNNGKEFTFYGTTRSTRNGTCERIKCDGITDSIESWCNRPWQSFSYQMALQRAIDKLPKEYREELTQKLITDRIEADRKRCNAFVNAFQAQYDKLSDKNKEIMAKTPTIQSQEQAEGVLGVMKMMNLMDEIMK